MALSEERVLRPCFDSCFNGRLTNKPKREDVAPRISNGACGY